MLETETTRNWNTELLSSIETMKEEGDKEKIISLKQAAEISGYSADYIGQLIRQGKLPGRQVYHNVAWTTSKEALQQYLAKNKKDVSSQLKAPKSLPQKFNAFIQSKSAAMLCKIALITTAVMLAIFLLLLSYILATSIDYKLQQRAMTKIEAANQK